MIELKDYGYKDYYSIIKDQVYNTKSKRYLKPDNKGCYTLMKADGKKHHISANTLLKRVYGAFYSTDNIENLPGEEWKLMNNSNFSISNYGRVKSHRLRETYLLEWDISTGYARVRIDIGYGLAHYSIHKLVAEHFLPGPKKPFYEVHHLDQDRLNNFYKNLMFVSSDEHRKIHRELRVREKNENENNE